MEDYTRKFTMRNTRRDILIEARSTLDYFKSPEVAAEWPDNNNENALRHLVVIFVVGDNELFGGGPLLSEETMACNYAQLLNRKPSYVTNELIEFKKFMHRDDITIEIYQLSQKSAG